SWIAPEALRTIVPPSPSGSAPSAMTLAATVIGPYRAVMLTLPPLPPPENVGDSTPDVAIRSNTWTSVPAVMVRSPPPPPSPPPAAPRAVAAQPQEHDLITGGDVDRAGVAAADVDVVTQGDLVRGGQIDLAAAD